MVTFKRFQRYFDWFRDKMVVKEESAIKQQIITETPVAIWNKVVPGVFYDSSSDFTINLFKRCKAAK